MNDDQSWLIEIVVWVIVNALIGYYLGTRRGQPQTGVWASVLLGPIGWLAILVSRDLRPKCPECGGVVIEGARKCLHCGSVIASIAVGGGVRRSRVPGVELKCPACGEAGFVREVSDDTLVECPTCHRQFQAAKAIV